MTNISNRIRYPSLLGSYGKMVAVHNFLQITENSPPRGCETFKSGGGRIAAVGSAMVGRLAVRNWTKKQLIGPPALLGFGRRVGNPTS
jgi:hypothetical protein